MTVIAGMFHLKKYSPQETGAARQGPFSGGTAGVDSLRSAKKHTLVYIIEKLVSQPPPGPFILQY